MVNDCGEISVTKQVLLSFTIGPYRDDVLCDVIPMHAGHILLGRPWQFDKKVIHDGFKNKYSFQHKGKPITLYPLTPAQVHEDQVKLQLERDKERAKGNTTLGETSESDVSGEKNKAKAVGVPKGSVSEREGETKGRVKKSFYMGEVEARKMSNASKFMLLLVYNEPHVYFTNTYPLLPVSISSLCRIIVTY